MPDIEPWVEIAQNLPVHAFVEASAGTGKTYTIERCVLEFVLRGVPIGEILLATFTEKAAMELRSRVRGILLEKTAEAKDEICRKTLRQALAAFDSAVITTLHGFAQRALSWFSLYTPYPYEQEVCTLETILPDTVRKLARGKWIQEEKTADALQIMLAETEGNFDRAVEILLECVKMPIELRFSNTPKTMDSSLLTHWKDTFEAMFSVSGIKGDKVVFWRERLEKFFQAEQWQEAVKNLSEIHPRTLNSFLQKCQDATQMLDPERCVFLNDWIQNTHRFMSLEKSPLHKACLVLVPSLREALEEEKRRLSVMTYGDMLERLDRALKDPDLGNLLAAQLQRRFSVGIVDEFQDTDELQWSILSRVFLEHPKGSLVVVGDPKQAIYRFRGADIHTYQKAKLELEKQGARIFSLGKNFRCTPEMVDAVNYFFGGDGPESFFTKQEVRYEKNLKCGKPGLKLNPPNVPIVFLGQSYCPHIKRHRWRFLLARQVAQEIQKIVDGGYRMEESREDGSVSCRAIDYRDIFILVPKHSEGRIVAGELREAGIPFAFYKRQTLFESAEARMITDVLRAILNPDRPNVRHKAFVTPFFDIKEREIAKAGLVMPHHPAMLFLLSLHEDARQGKSAETLRRLELESGVYRRLASFVSTRRDAINCERIFSILRHLVTTRLWTLQQVQNAMESWIRGGEVDPEIADLAMEVTDPTENAVRILTMHNAKGLEAPIVFLYGGFSSSSKPQVKMYHSHEEKKRVLFVGEMGKEEKKQYEAEEEGDAERLMYVAMTRAKALCFVQVDAIGKPEEQKEEDIQKPFFRGVSSTVLRRLAKMNIPPHLFRHQIENVSCSDCRQDKTPFQKPDLQQKTDENQEIELAPWEEAQSDPLQWLQRQTALFSYSGLKKLGVEIMPEEKEEPEANLLPDVPEGEPPPGTRTGLAVHALCEIVDIAELRAAVHADAWLDAPGREEMICRELTRFGLPATLWRRVGEMVHAAYCTPVVTDEISLPALCNSSALIREAEFRISWDERLRACLSAFFPHVPRASGSLMGYFDALAELDGKLWLVDWKTDLLPDYSPQSVRAHVQAHYVLQAVIYEDALLRMRPHLPYGGFLYVFVRGLENRGIVMLPPGWRPQNNNKNYYF